MRVSNCLQYKGYSGSIEFSEDEGVFHCKVVGTKAFISFEGDSICLIAEDFQSAID